ncbi:uncharacterized protein LOC130896336 [Diorhabda carinulata]|uniref:uncharacterized protein LOC130896336 n=1 Tax=Diorhabda carinulata TaxID=1163345 RepID=UPI0025A1CDE6|nr:uncharacterized protein LOC130896336 [Diorhabda carinulata]
MWLSMYIKQNLQENLGILSVENLEYQNCIQRHLIEIVKYRLMFKEAFSKIYISQELMITLLSLGGVLTGVMCIYNLKNATHQGSSIKLYLIIAVETIVMISLCVCGQTVADESIHMRDVLYECPWVYWNTRNRKILLIIITNIEKPWTISLYNLFILNNEMVIQAAKFVYSLATVVANMK